MYCGWHKAKIKQINEKGGGLAEIIDGDYRRRVVGFSNGDGFKGYRPDDVVDVFLSYGSFPTIRTKNA